MSRAKTILITTVCTVFLGANLIAQEGKVFDYTGAKGCRKCHKSVKSGEQYKIWLENSHAKAYETLASEESLKIAKEKGIADPQKADECLKCHVTAYDAPAERLGKRYAIEEGVSCESCHGAGSAYSKKKIKKAIVAGEMDPASVGLLKVTKETCVDCHNEESPTYKPFDYEKQKEKIAHPKPKG
ncbi:MAG: cytochrome C554 [Calditrichaeota bacterium]|nr:MAG: cytochrome C554 [Calditrichota bacterium]